MDFLKAFYKKGGKGLQELDDVEFLRDVVCK